MDIKTAAVAAKAVGGFITRRVWEGVLMVKPGNSPECCLCYVADTEVPRPRWQPRAEDLEAEDWELILLSDYLLLRLEARCRHTEP